MSLLLVCLAACKTNDFIENEVEPDRTVQKRSLNDAMQNADNLFTYISNATTKSKLRSVKSVNVLGVSDQRTKAAGGVVDTMYYIVNYDDGYAILGADCRLEPVYAICDEGEFNIADSVNHPGVKMVLYGLEQRALEINTNATTKVGQLDGFNDYEWTPIVAVQELNEKCGPFGRHRKWGQDAPFNKCCFTANGLWSIFKWS